MCCIALADLVENIGINDFDYTWNENDDLKSKEEKKEENEIDCLQEMIDITKEKHEINRNQKPIENELFSLFFQQWSETVRARPAAAGKQTAKHSRKNK